MTDTILPSLDAIQARADAEPCKEGRVYLTRLVDGRRAVFATSEGTVCVTHGRNWPCTAAKEPCLHQPEWSCGNPAHTNLDVGCPDCAEHCTDCDQAWPCPTIRAITAHIDTTPKETT